MVKGMRIYFMGICGAAMGNVALLMRSLGHEVCGSDTGIYPPMSELLKSAGVTLLEGYDAAQLEHFAPDLVVVGNVVSRGHPEMEWLLDSRAFRYVSMPQLLQEELLAARKNIVISGTHGKTTTSCLTAYLLKTQGRDPGYLIGGVPRDLPGGASVGDTSAPFVIEGDEYDSAFFDKRSKFIHYLPSILTINNIEFDHGDIFRDLEDVKRTFRHVLRIVPRSGTVLVNGEDEVTASLLPAPWTHVVRVGEDRSNDLEIRDFEETVDGSQFALIWRGKLWSEVETTLGGFYNARNVAMAAAAAGLALNPEDPTTLDLTFLKYFQGVKRRQELLLDTPNMCVLEDFAHHPTAVRDTVISLKKRYPEHRLSICFEPRSNTACSKVFEDRLHECFLDADKTYIGKIHRGGTISDEQRLDVEGVCKRINGLKGASVAEAHTCNQALLQSLLHSTQKAAGPQLVCFLSNGSFDGIMPAFVKSIQPNGN